MSEERLTTRDLAEPRPDRSDRPAEPVRQAVAAPTPAETVSPMFPEDESLGYRTRWDAIQTGFVDEPRKAVEEADELVAEVMKRLAESFAREREEMERQWDQGTQISTEDLRIALRRYRSFFHRLLSM